VVYANINSSEEDFTFLLTALYHWESLYPTFSNDFPKDPKEITVKTKPKEEAKKEGSDAEDMDLAKSFLAMEENNTDLQELINIQKQ
jgi:hypothetical protein